MNDTFSFASILFVTFFFAFSEPCAAELHESPGNFEEKVATAVFEGKLYCALRRPVPMYFPGTVSEIMTAPGELVEKGEVIAHYRMDEFRALQLGREILFEELTDLRRRLESEKLKLIELERNETELQELTEAKLSPRYLLERLQKEVELTREYIFFLEKTIHCFEEF